MSGDVYGWYTLPMSNAGCTVSNWAAAANTAAANAGVNLSTYQHVVYAFPFADSCSWSGLAEMPGSRVWINGYFRAPDARPRAQPQPRRAPRVVADLPERQLAGCLQQLVLVQRVRRSVRHHGLGSRQTSMYHKAQIGWLDPLAQQTVTTSGTYTISPMEWAAGGVQSLRIPRGTPASTCTSSTAGRSARLRQLQPHRPGRERREHPARARLHGDQPLVPDRHEPATPTFIDAPLRAGQTFTDSATASRSRPVP